MPTCKYCKAEKPNREMASWGGTTTETCLECKAARKAAKNGKTAEATTPTPPPSALPVTEIVVEATLGFAAKVDGDSLFITQANDTEKDDNVTLTRAEAKALFAVFGEWAAGK